MHDQACIEEWSSAGSALHPLKRCRPDQSPINRQQSAVLFSQISERWFFDAEIRAKLTGLRKLA